MEFYIGQIFEDIYPPEAADWCNSNNAMMVKIDPVVRTVTEEYETVEEEAILIPAVTHIETDEDGNEHEVIDVPEHEETVYNPVIKTREVEKELRCFRIDAIPEPTEQEIAQVRITELKRLLDSKDYWTSKRADGEYTEEQWAEKVAQRKAWRAEINELEKVLTKTEESAIIE